MDCIENRTFDELKVGETASLARTLTYKDIELFAIMSGDVNPAHVDEAFAKSDMFHKIVAHGMWGGALISTVLGTQMPGPGTIYLNQSLRFGGPVGLGDTITITLKVAEEKTGKTSRYSRLPSGESARSNRDHRYRGGHRAHRKDLQAKGYTARGGIA